VLEFTVEQKMLRDTIANFAEKRDAKLQTIGGGISEIQRIIIAREILKD